MSAEIATQGQATATAPCLLGVHAPDSFNGRRRARPYMRAGRSAPSAPRAGSSWRKLSHQTRSRLPRRERLLRQRCKTPSRYAGSRMGPTGRAVSGPMQSAGRHSPRLLLDKRGPTPSGAGSMSSLLRGWLLPNPGATRQKES